MSHAFVFSDFSDPCIPTSATINLNLFESTMIFSRLTKSPKLKVQFMFKLWSLSLKASCLSKQIKEAWTTNLGAQLINCAHCFLNPKPRHLHMNLLSPPVGPGPAPHFWYVSVTTNSACPVLTNLIKWRPPGYVTLCLCCPERLDFQNESCEVVQMVLPKELQTVLRNQTSTDRHIFNGWCKTEKSRKFGAKYFAILDSSTHVSSIFTGTVSISY